VPRAGLLIYVYAYVADVARAIAISDEVYELLKRSKLPGESFSSVIKRGLQSRKLSEIAGSGTLSAADWRAARARLDEADAESAKELTGGP
jgi:predicted CopG family antitoxin